MELDPRIEWHRVRVAARITQAFVVLAALGFIGRFASVTPDESQSLALVASIIAGLGLAPLSILIGNIAQWASDERAVRLWRVCVILLPMLVGVVILSIYNHWTGFFVTYRDLPVTPFWLWGGMLYTLTVFIPMGFFLVALFGLRSMGVWALANRIQEEARTARLLERFQSDRFNADAQREHGVIQDTSQPLTALMPAPSSRASAGTPADGIRPGNKRPARTIWD